MGTARILTDAGPAFIKAMGNRQGPHPLACEWVGTQLAAWFGLPTFDYALLNLGPADEIPFVRGGTAAPGPAFVTRLVEGRVWGGTVEELELLQNLEALSRLVVFDTWTRNCDRHPPDLAKRKPNKDNVFLSREGAAEGRFRLIAMDHTHCFTCGRDLTERIADIDHVKDDRLYGLFPAFLPLLRREEVQSAAARLREADRAGLTVIVESVPAAWVDFLYRRAEFVADTLVERLLACCPTG